MQYAVIMAGGQGTRLWPAARRSRPKQLHRLIFKEPLIVETVDRLAHLYQRENILIVTAQQYTDPIREILSDLPPENIISEPVGRNTAAAIALAAFQIGREDPNGVFAVFPADHVILKPEALFDALRFAGDLAQHHRVIDIGVPPSHPETGYGYIELGEEIERRGKFVAHTVQRFVEKPDRERAEEYVQAGNYIWNSGMFVWRAGAYLDALQEFLPTTYNELAPAFESGNWTELEAAYERIPEQSVDYGIMEKVSDVVAIPVDFGWRDVGDWAALYDLMEHDAHGNATEGEVVTLDTHNSLLIGSNRLLATVGLEDLIVVDTEDVLLVMPRNRAQEVKQLLEQLKKTGRERYL